MSEIDCILIVFMMRGLRYWNVLLQTGITVMMGVDEHMVLWWNQTMKWHMSSILVPTVYPQNAQTNENAM
jgi:hypothetical protein